MNETSAKKLRWAFLGQVDYQRALELQFELRDAITAGAEDTLLLLEHPPVITLGRSARPENVLADDSQLIAAGVGRVQISRGGDVTYHGPGQLVGYPLRLVGRAVRKHVEAISGALIALLGEFGVEAHWRGDNPGIWTEQGKIAALGIDARSKVAMHGFSLNVAPKLEHYRLIVPCGLAEADVTSMAALGVDPLPNMEELAQRLASLLATAFGCELVAIAAQSILSASSATIEGD